MGQWLPILFSCLMASASPDAYTLTATCAVSNNACDLRVNIQAHQEWTMKTQTPLSLVLQLPEGAKSEKASFTQSDLELQGNKQGTLRTRVTFLKNKTRPIQISGSFYLCTPQVCQRFNVDKKSLL